MKLTARTTKRAIHLLILGLLVYLCNNVLTKLMIYKYNLHI